MSGYEQRQAQLAANADVKWYAYNLARSVEYQYSQSCWFVKSVVSTILNCSMCIILSLHHRIVSAGVLFAGVF